MRKILSLALATVFISSAAIAAPSPSQPPVKRTDLQRHDLSIAGHETVQARIDIAPGATAPWHRHPARR